MRHYAEQAARANDHSGDAAGDRMDGRNEAAEPKEFGGTRRARGGRGSSLTCGKTFQQAMRQGESLQKRCDAMWRGVHLQFTRSLLVAPVAELGCSVHGRRWFVSFRLPVTADQGCVF
jgi:hypothetical protein